AAFRAVSLWWSDRASIFPRDQSPSGPDGQETARPLTSLRATEAAGTRVVASSTSWSLTDWTSTVTETRLTHFVPWSVLQKQHGHFDRRRRLHYPSGRNTSPQGEQSWPGCIWTNSRSGRSSATA